MFVLPTFFVSFQKKLEMQELCWVDEVKNQAIHDQGKSPYLGLRLRLGLIPKASKSLRAISRTFFSVLKSLTIFFTRS